MKFNPAKTNPHISALAKKLHQVSKKENAGIWDSVSRILLGPSQNWAEVNIGKLGRITNANDVVLVPGKVLSAGTISHPVSVYAFKASASAKKQILAAKGKLGTIEELVEKNPKGTGVKLLK